MLEKTVALLTASIILSSPATGNIDREIISNHSATALNIGTEESQTQTASNVEITFDEEIEVNKNSSGIELLESEYRFPVVNIMGNKAASDKINAYYMNVKESFRSYVKELTAYAEEDYKARDQEQLKYWNSYLASAKYEVARADNRILSLVHNNSEYAGGAHPNTTRFTDNFSVQTGEKLAFKDVVRDEAEAREIVTANIIKQTNNPEYKGYFFEDYEKSIPDLITDTTWYLSEEGFVIIANEYIIGPHALGIIEFTIPYKEAGFLKDIYLIK